MDGTGLDGYRGNGKFRCLYLTFWCEISDREDGFAPASIVAPLGTIAILCNALIAPLVFHETFRFRDFMGVVLSALGAVTIVLSAETKEDKVIFSPPIRHSHNLAFSK